MIDVNEVVKIQLSVVTQQRNAALDEIARLAALLEMAKRDVPQPLQEDNKKE